MVPRIKGEKKRGAQAIHSSASSGRTIMPCTMHSEQPHIPEAKSITFYLENVHGGIIKQLKKKPTKTGIL
jgi:hypothetical protein